MGQSGFNSLYQRCIILKRYGLMLMTLDTQSRDRGSIPLTVSIWLLAPNQFQEAQSMLIWSNGRIPHCLWGDQGSIPCINECILFKRYGLMDMTLDSQSRDRGSIPLTVTYPCGSSRAEHLAVVQKVAGSNPVPGSTQSKC